MRDKHKQNFCNPSDIQEKYPYLVPFHQVQTLLENNIFDEIRVKYISLLFKDINNVVKKVIKHNESGSDAQI